MIKNTHETILLNKINNTNDDNLKSCYKKFLEFKERTLKLNIINKQDVKKLVEYFNHYRNECAYIYEKRKNSGQELIRSSMLEGFFQLLFKDIVKKFIKNETMIIGKAKTIVGFNFSPFSFENAFQNINFNLLEKDQDFVIGIKIRLKLKEYDKDYTSIILPFVIIECKTYIEKNMLETHINSASSVKKIIPDCLYFVAAEYMKMKSGEPHLSKLDDVYIFCQEINSIRENKMKNNHKIKEINYELISNLFLRVKDHLEKKWWDNKEFINIGRILKSS